MPRFAAITLSDFQRAFDELFAELLTTPWRCGEARAEFERAEVVDLPDHYEVRIAVPRERARDVGVEVHGQRLMLRAPSTLGGSIDSSYSFSGPIDAERVSARWANNVLTIEVPKAKGQRVALKIN
jgi:HSP20 family molecular chaperone IbpA